MPKYCRCGGKFVFVGESKEAFIVQCPKCSATYTQKKRQSLTTK